MKRTLWLTACMLAAISCVGCGDRSDADTQQMANSMAAAMTTVNIHINGFKKSKSGAT